jgi:hypothetical protein
LEDEMARTPNRAGGATRLPADGDDQALFDQVTSAQDATQFDESDPGGIEPGAEESAPPEPEIRHVPLAELLDERDRRKAAEQRVAQYERSERERSEQQPAPDHILNPNEFTDQRVQQILAPILQPLYQHVAHTNRALAVSTHGQDAVDAAQKAFDEEWSGGRMDRAENFRVMSQPNPFMAAVEWHRNRTVLSEVGNDPAAYRQRLADELLQNPEFLARAIETARGQGASRPVTAAPRVAGSRAPPSRPPNGGLPPSLNRQGPPGGQPPALLDTDDDSLYSEMTNPNKYSE